eukprot:1159970-Pelagomonas_calceolata.AAC.3
MIGMIKLETNHVQQIGQLTPSGKVEHNIKGALPIIQCLLPLNALQSVPCVQCLLPLSALRSVPCVQCLLPLSALQSCLAISALRSVPLAPSYNPFLSFAPQCLAISAFRPSVPCVQSALPLRCLAKLRDEGKSEARPNFIVNVRDNDKSERRTKPER